MSVRAGRDRFCAELVAWLNRRMAPPGTIIGRETALFAGGLINSIRILDIIAWVERAIGRPIPDEDIRMDNFHSVGRIADVFLPERQHVGA